MLIMEAPPALIELFIEEINETVELGGGFDFNAFVVLDLDRNYTVDEIIEIGGDAYKALRDMVPRLCALLLHTRDDLRAFSPYLLRERRVRNLLEEIEAENNASEGVRMLLGEAL